MNLTVSHLDKLRLPLLHKLYKSNYPSGKPKGKEDIITLENDSIIIGAMRVKNYEDCHFLTGMMIIEDMRGKKLASYLLQHIDDFITSKKCYCLCEPKLSSFYIQNGFTHTNIDTSPHVIQTKHERYTSSGKNLDLLIYKKSHN